jgi:hypothetical protein
MSLFGTFRTWRDVWFESAMRTTTDIQAGRIKGNTAASIAMTASRFEHVPWCGTTCAAAKSYDNIRDHFAHYRHLPNKRFAQSSSNGSRASTSDKHRAVVTTEGGYAMFVDRIKSPRCPKCGAMMSLRIIEPERPGFDSRTFECPKCYDTETFVASISHEIRVSIGPA